jgi:hypothetical protein
VSFKNKFRVLNKNNFQKLGKRSRKAQQEAKNKGGGGNSDNNNEEKQSRSSSSSAPTTVGSNQSAHRNGHEKVMTNLTNNNFHFSKSIDPSHLTQNPILSLQHQRHLAAKDVLANGVDESYAINRAQSNVQFISSNQEEDQMIWRVV